MHEILKHGLDEVLGDISFTYMYRIIKSDLKMITLACEAKKLYLTRQPYFNISFKRYTNLL